MPHPASRLTEEKTKDKWPEFSALEEDGGVPEPEALVIGHSCQLLLGWRKRARRLLLGELFRLYPPDQQSDVVQGRLVCDWLVVMVGVRVEQVWGGVRLSGGGEGSKRPGHLILQGGCDLAGGEAELPVEAGIKRGRCVFSFRKVVSKVGCTEIILWSVVGKYWNFYF